MRHDQNESIRPLVPFPLRFHLLFDRHLSAVVDLDADLESIALAHPVRFRPAALLRPLQPDAGQDLELRHPDFVLDFRLLASPAVNDLGPPGVSALDDADDLDPSAPPLVRYPPAGFFLPRFQRSAGEVESGKLLGSEAVSSGELDSLVAPESPDGRGTGVFLYSGLL